MKPFIRREAIKFACAAPALLAPKGPALRAEAADRSLWPAFSKGQTVFGYVDVHSVCEGDTFNVMLSTKPGAQPVKGRIEFHRIGPHLEQVPVWSETISVAQQELLATAASVGAGWYPVTTIDTTNWRPGVYHADFVHGTTGRRDSAILQVIVRSKATARDILLKLGTNTYQAYNDWGGHSLYTRGDVPSTRGAMVAFDRPTKPLFLDFDLYLVRWIEALAEEHHISVDYASNYDTHRDRNLVDGPHLIVGSSHDEYWTKEEYDAYENRIHRLGRNTIFFGANTGYWQVRYFDLNCPPGGEDRARQMLCWKTTRDPILERATQLDKALLTTNRFRDFGRRPETMLTGSAYQSWFPNEDSSLQFSYYVTSTDSPFFAGTGLRAGDSIGNVVGYEWDNRDPDGDGKRLWSNSSSRTPRLPADQIKVLFTGRTTDFQGHPGLAEAVYFETAAGAKVFNAGSIRWAWGLGKEGYVNKPFQKFNENLILGLLR